MIVDMRRRCQITSWIFYGSRSSSDICTEELEILCSETFNLNRDFLPTGIRVEYTSYIIKYKICFKVVSVSLIVDVRRLISEE